MTDTDVELVPSGRHYLDSSVILRLVWDPISGLDSKAAKEFLKALAMESLVGIVSPWTLMEIISVVRIALVRNGMTRMSSIEEQVSKVLKAIFRLEGLEFVRFSNSEMADLDIEPMSLGDFLEQSLEHYRESKYEVKEVGSPPRDTILGIGNADALHIFLALASGCDYLAALDRDFWADKRPIKLFDVRKVRSDNGS